MRSLRQALDEHELTTLRVIGEWWELDLTGTDKKAAVDLLVTALGNLDMQQEIIFLPPEEAAALNDLVAQGGRAAVAVFSREHGEVRQMGPGRMEREEPWLDPVSPAEALWYRGFLYRAFDDTAEGLLEFYFLPPELLAGFPQPAGGQDSQAVQTLRPMAAAPAQYEAVVTNAVDDLTALLAVALHLTMQPDQRPDLDRLLLNPDPERRSFLLTLASELGLVRRVEGQLRPTQAAVTWLKQGREGQLFTLADAWSNSDWNDLCHTPGLQCEGEKWHNDPILARSALLDALPRTTQWYLLDDLTNLIKETNPDFQRPDGNYDTWYIRDQSLGGYLAGFEAWDHVEGRLLKFLIQGPLFWLSMVEKTEEAAGMHGSSFRLSECGLRWLGGQGPRPDPDPRPIEVQADGTIRVPLSASRYHRFQVARISESLGTAGGQPFRYQLTAASLAQAREQNIKPDRLLQFLEQASGHTLPKSVQRAVERWADKGIEGRLESVVVLRVSDERILETLRANPKTRDYLGESLGELAVTVKQDAWEKLRLATAQLGLLLDVEL